MRMSLSRGDYLAEVRSCADSAYSESVANRFKEFAQIAEQAGVDFSDSFAYIPLTAILCDDPYQFLSNAELGGLLRLIAWTTRSWNDFGCETDDWHLAHFAGLKKEWNEPSDVFSDKTKGQVIKELFYNVQGVLVHPWGVIQCRIKPDQISKERGLKRAGRQSIGAKQRFKILKRDNFRCVYCGTSGKEICLEIDHIIPVCEGGTDDDDNLATACSECNMGKSGDLLEAAI